MGHLAAAAAVDTHTLILDAARSRLLAGGHAGLSTRKVAEEAAVPVSQLHYHLGSKQGLILALFEEENQRRLDRQRSMYAEDLPLWQRYEQACDFLEAAVREPGSSPRLRAHLPLATTP